MKIIFCANTLLGFCSFRLDVVIHLIDQGNSVLIVFPFKDGDDRIVEGLPSGVRTIKCDMQPNGKDIISDLRFLKSLYTIYKTEKPDIVFHYTIKPNIYGTLAASWLGINVVDVMAGLGMAFNGNSFQKRLLRLVYRFSLRKADKVLTLNESDYHYLLSHRFVKESRLVLMKCGEGVNLQKFQYSDGSFMSPRFLMVGRLLYTKGVSEYIRAAKYVRQRYPETLFYLAGTHDASSYDSLSKSELDQAVIAGDIIYLGFVKNIVKLVSDPNTVIVLPSYYKEGLNRSLMEACAIGRPIITTNLPGLREMVENGKNGFLIEPRSVDSLVNAVLRFLSLPTGERRDMGRYSGRIAYEHFDMSKVYRIYDEVIASLG